MGSPMVGLERMDAKVTWVPGEPRGRRKRSDRKKTNSHTGKDKAL